MYKVENINTVEIVHETWELAHFYHENEASIFDAKIQLRWLKTVSSTFQDLDFDVSL